MDLDLCDLCNLCRKCTKVVHVSDLSLYLLADFLQKIFAGGKICRKSRAIAELSGAPAPTPLVPAKGGPTLSKGTLASMPLCAYRYVAVHNAPVSAH